MSDSETEIDESDFRYEPDESEDDFNYAEELSKEQECLNCKVIRKNFISLIMYYNEEGKIYRYFCCQNCINEIYKKDLENEIIKNYNDFLKNGLKDEDPLHYYNQLSQNFSNNSYKKLGKILHEIYEYENDNSYILK